jgi:HlyD family secretion protein
MTAAGFQHRAARSLDRHAIFGSIAALAFAGGLTYWAATTPISGAVVAGGSVVVDGGVQRIQHQEGGIVEQILVHNQSRVSAGDPLIVLDHTAVAANLAVIESQLAEAYVRRARLAAESDRTDAMTWPGALDQLPDAVRNLAIFEAEDRLRVSRAATFAHQTGQLNEQVVQLENQIAGLEAQHGAIARQLEIVSEQLQAFETLLSQRLMEASRVVEIRSHAAQLEGEQARVLTEIARGRAAIAEKKLQISQAAESVQTDALTGLQEINQKIAELEQQQIAMRNRLDRLIVRAPISGIVHDLQIATVGGVVGPGATLLQVVPQDENTRIDVHLNPLDIDKLKIDQAVSLRFSSFNARETPELAGMVERISPDLMRDPVNGSQFYLVRVSLSDTERDRLPQDVRLIPGMPVEAYFTTGERSVLNYIIKPALDQMTLAFRED